jgi:hypothetical protein
MDLLPLGRKIGLKSSNLAVKFTNDTDIFHSMCGFFTGDGFSMRIEKFSLYSPPLLLDLCVCLFSVKDGWGSDALYVDESYTFQ